MSRLSKEALVRLAREKARAAWTLLEKGHYSDAYYLVGYAVEFALKAKIAEEFVAQSIPDKKRVSDIYTHDIEKLVRFAGLYDELDKSMTTDKLLKERWDIVRAWDEQSRYMDHSVEEAYAMVNSVVGDPGVLSWILSFV